MTALLTLERAKLVATRSPPPTTAPPPVESQIGLRPGERMTVADLLRGLLLESGQRRGGDARRGRRRARARRSCALMNRRARELGLDEHALREPDRARRAGQLLHRARPRRRSPCVLRTHSLLPQDRRPHARRRSRTGDRPRTFDNRNTLRRQRPAGSTASRPATRAGAATCWSARARAQRRPARLRRARHAERGRARRATRSRCCTWGFAQLPARAPGRCAGDVVGDARPIRYRRGAELALVAGAHASRRIVRAASATTSRPRRRRARRGRRARSARGQRLGARRGARRRQARSRRVPLVAAASRPGRRPRAEAPRPGSPRPLRAARSRSPSLGGTRAGGAAAARAARPRAAPPLGAGAPHDHHRHAQHGDRQDARGAELPARPPPPHRRADDDAGRQGRQRRARAQDARRSP